MPRNTNKTRCSVPDCRAWAIRGSDPPRCPPHSGRAAAPAGNQNRLIHGYYSRPPRSDSPDPASYPTGAGLEAELAIARAALDRLAHMLQTGVTPGPDPQPLTPADYARYTELTFYGAGTVSRLLRARAALSSGDTASPEDDLAQLWASFDHEVAKP